MAKIIKSHSDILTVPEALERMKRAYKSQGYYCDLLFNRLTVYTNDGHLDIFWKDGAFYEENYYNS